MPKIEARLMSSWKTLLHPQKFQRLTQGIRWRDAIDLWVRAGGFHRRHLEKRVPDTFANTVHRRVHRFDPLAFAAHCRNDTPGALTHVARMLFEPCCRRAFGSSRQVVVSFRNGPGAAIAIVDVNRKAKGFACAEPVLPHGTIRRCG